MAHVYADRVKETSTTTGTGTFNLSGPTSGFRSFVSGIGTGNTTVYACVHQTLAEWEVGVGTVTDAATDTLSRTTILASSNSGSAVSFSAGTKDIFCSMAADRTVLKDASGNAVLGTPASGTLTNCTGLPVSTGVSGLGTGVATFLATPSSANFASCVTGETGSGAVVFGTSPTLDSPTINGTPVMGASIITSGTSVASTSGTSIDFTGIPSWVKRVTVMFNGVSTTGSSLVIVRLGTSGGIETASYAGNLHSLGTSTISSQLVTSGFAIMVNGASSIMNGVASISLLNAATNLWVVFGAVSENATTGGASFSGTKSLAGTLDRVRITTVNGTDTFDAGTINILYE